ncbi:hypothetical protein J4456_05180 [Candidatus Pacearchaeota archaeon]|nr:hypothetical protein [Candidatus Pacearchaeota archaeon]
MKLEDMIIKDIGKTDYLQTIRLQKSLVEKRADGEIQDMILFSEHFPTIDFGSAVTHNTFSNLLLIEVRKKYENNDMNSILKFLESKGILFSETVRGGGATYIGPGQIMVYPIIDLKENFGNSLAVSEYKEAIDRIMLNVLQSFGIPAETFTVEKILGESSMRKDRKDIWITQNNKHYKLGGKGIRVTQGIAHHGFNLYLNAESISGFRYINACGYTPEELGVTSIEHLLGKKIDREEFKTKIVSEFYQQLRERYAIKHN